MKSFGVSEASLTIIHKLSGKTEHSTGGVFVSCCLQGSLSWLNASKI